jgi:RNA polymerase sigma-70 factor (ECF subfamily)
MDARIADERWARLFRLLQPLHTQAVTTARRLCRSAADGDDLYQETVLRAFEKLHTLREESRFRAWFFATLLSRHRSRVRRLFWKRFVSLEEEVESGREPAGANAAEWAEERWRAARMSRALAALAAEQREAIVLFDLEGFSLEEVATAQGASVSAVKTRLRRGREKLRRIYERYGWSPRAAEAPRATPVAELVGERGSRD